MVAVNEYLIFYTHFKVISFWSFGLTTMMNVCFFYNVSSFLSLAPLHSQRCGLILALW